MAAAANATAAMAAKDRASGSREWVAKKMTAPGKAMPDRVANARPGELRRTSSSVSVSALRWTSSQYVIVLPAYVVGPWQRNRRRIVPPLARTTTARGPKECQQGNSATRCLHCLAGQIPIVGGGILVPPCEGSRVVDGCTPPP